MSGIAGLPRVLKRSANSVTGASLKTDSNAAWVLRERAPGLWGGLAERREACKKIVPVLKGMEAEGYTIGEGVCSLALSRCDSTQSADAHPRALQIVKTFFTERSPPRPLPPYVQGALLSVSASRGVSSYMNTFEWLSSIGKVKTSTSITNTHLKAIEVDFFLSTPEHRGKLWGDAKALLTADVIASVVTMTMFIKLAHTTEHLEWVLGQMKERDIIFDRTVYTELIRYGGRVNDIEVAKTWLEVCHNDVHAAPDVQVLNAFLSTAGKCSSKALVKQTFIRMCTLPAPCTANTMSVQIITRHLTYTEVQELLTQFPFLVKRLDGHTKETLRRLKERHFAAEKKERSRQGVQFVRGGGGGGAVSATASSAGSTKKKGRPERGTTPPAPSERAQQNTHHRKKNATGTVDASALFKFL